MLTRKQILGAMLGIALEVYDFTVYAYFALAIAHNFFPATSAYLSLLLSLATFGVGFVSRPIGAFVLGRYADRVGRRSAMVISFLLMGAAGLVLALTPGYARIGILAPIIVLVARLVQGFALGGEVGATTALLLEGAPPEKRGFYASLQYVAQGLAAILAGFVGIALSSWLDAAALNDYGWRIAFLIGAAIVPLGFAVRRSLPETLTPQLHAPGPEGGTRRVAMLALMIIAGMTIQNYVFKYMTTYALDSLHMDPRIAFAAPVVTGLCVAIFTVVGGTLSDRFGRRPLMLLPTCLLVVAIYPTFVALSAYSSAASFLGGLALLSIPSSLSGGASLTAITESLPPELRSTALSLIYAVAVAIFGGSAQVVVTWLIHVTQDPTSPAWYLLAASLVAFTAQMLMPESAPNARPQH